MKTIAAALLALLAISGCARHGGPVAEDARSQRWSELRQALGEYRTWHLHGRAVVSRATELYNIGLRWRQEPREFVMLLEAPFGQGVFRIDGDADGGYRLLLPDGQEFKNDTPEALLDEVIGWSIPISGMRYWIRGLPRPDSEYRLRLDDDGRARSIRQDSWSIEFNEYFDDDSEPRLPRRINLARDEFKVKLAIEHWQQSEVEQHPPDLFPEFD